MTTPSSDELEAALPTLIEKLQQLQQGLTPEEQLVFQEIIESAALHTQSIQGQDVRGHTAQDFSASYVKPMSSMATFAMRQQYLTLPQLFNVQGWQR